MTERFLREYVLENQVNNEPLVDFRQVFGPELQKRTAGLSPVEAALEVNLWCAEHACYRFNDSPTADPLTVYFRGHGRCGELSVFVVDSMRSAGIPARQVYVPRWSHCDDNHAWVEVFVEGDWHYLGACEPEPVLDRGWFTSPAKRAMVIRSKKADGTYENQTFRYAEVQDWRFFTHPGAQVTGYILNDGALHPVGQWWADGAGMATARLGKGDLWVVSRWGDRWGELLCKGKTGSEFAIPLEGPRYSPDEVLRFEAPDAPTAFPPPLSLSQQLRKTELLAQAQTRRLAWVAAHPVEANAPDLPGGQGFDLPLAGRSIAATRLPCGDQLFRIAPAGCPLEPPTARPEELLVELELPTPVGGPCLMAWVKKGEEPTAHFLNELKDFGEFPVPVKLVEGPAPEELPRTLGLDPGSPPLLALVDPKGKCRYAAAGYQVGSVELAARLAKLLQDVVRPKA